MRIMPVESREWRGPDGTVLSCREKLRVLEEGLAEFQGIAQDLMEDALLMGVDEAQIRAELSAVVCNVSNPYGIGRNEPVQGGAPQRSQNLGQKLDQAGG